MCEHLIKIPQFVGKPYKNNKRLNQNNTKKAYHNCGENYFKSRLFVSRRGGRLWAEYRNNQWSLSLGPAWGDSGGFNRHAPETGTGAGLLRSAQCYTCCFTTVRLLRRCLLWNLISKLRLDWYQFFMRIFKTYNESCNKWLKGCKCPMSIMFHSRGVSVSVVPVRPTIMVIDHTIHISQISIHSHLIV